jgi:hypothetical protein
MRCSNVADIVKALKVHDPDGAFKTDLEKLNGDSDFSEVLEVCEKMGLDMDMNIIERKTNE